MSKRIKYFVSSVLSALTFYLFLGLPFETRYYGLMVGVVLIIFCFWFGLGIMFEKSVYDRIMAAILPVGFFIGFGLFAVLLPLGWLWRIGISIIYGLINYAMFLVENVFMVAIGYKTVPLYRAAYTVGLIMLLTMSFFLFDTVFSFRSIYWLNGLGIFGAGIMVFSYLFWSIAIELPDDGKDKNKLMYILVPSWLLALIGVAFSFWPVGIFKGSIFLVAVIYIMAGLMQADIRDRLFKRTWLTFVWIGIASLLGMITMTNWK